MLGEDKMKRNSELDMATMLESAVIEKDAAKLVKQQSL